VKKQKKSGGALRLPGRTLGGDTTEKNIEEGEKGRALDEGQELVRLAPGRRARRGR